MELDRRVQIRVALRGEDSKGFGTGYLVAPRLVLTADHVLDDLDPDGGRFAVTVCRPDDGEREYPASVCWRQRDDKADAALVEIAADCHWPVPESLSDLIARPPQRYGHLIGTRSHPVSLTGFPRFQKDPKQGRLDEHLEGQITPGTGALADRYEVTSTTPVPVGPPAADGTCWSGTSGAAVLAGDGSVGDLLCGIVRHDRQADGGTRLTATPISHLLTDRDGCPSEFRRLVAEHTGWNPVLEPIEPAPLLKPATADRDLDSPAALLRADTEAVAFHGRDQELADLHAWCTTNPAKIAIQVITGPGGQGKTRLARHLTDTLSHENWVTGHLRSDLTDHDTSPDLTPLTTALPLLLVVDYAETRPRLLRRLVTHLHTTRHRVRLLLLARSDGEWRTDPLSATAPVRRLLATAPVVPLGPLQPTDRPDQNRNKDFRNAVRDLALLLPRVRSAPGHDWTALASTLRPADDLTHPRYDNVLTLQMTALVTLLQNGPRPVNTDPGDPAEKILLEHEERFWKDSADADAFELGLDTSTLKAAVAVAALCGADTEKEALDVIKALPGLQDHQQPSATAWLASLYPGGPGRYWGSLQPDRVAEYHASQTLEENSNLLPFLLAKGTPAQQAHAITVLSRAATSHHDAHRAADATRTLTVLGAVLDLDTVSLDPQALDAAVSALPYPAGVLAPLALRLTRDFTAALGSLPFRQRRIRRADLARALYELGLRLSEMGRHKEALKATRKAVRMRRRLAVGNSDGFDPDLARVLGNLGADLAEVGQWKKALDPLERAAELYQRQLLGSGTFASDLVISLGNLSAVLVQMERLEEALIATERAVTICRHLAVGDSGTFAPDLARALVNLGAVLSKDERLEEALAAFEEAVEIYQPLAVGSPSRFDPDFARALSNLGAVLSQVGRLEEGVKAAEEAVKVRSRLAAGNADRFDPDLATSLYNLGMDLAEVGRREEALPAFEEAIEIYRRLATELPVMFADKLRFALWAHADVLHRLESTEEGQQTDRPDTDHQTEE